MTPRSRFLHLVAAVTGIFAASVALSANQSVAVDLGKSVTFTASPSGSAPFTYQWMKDGNPIGTATGAIYKITKAQLADSGVYAVVVSNEAGSVTSTGVSISVAGPLKIALRSATPVVVAGSDVALEVDVTGAEPISLQWQVRPNESSQWSDVPNRTPYSGATSTVLTITGADASLNGSQYQCTAFNSTGSAPSPTATLTVNVRTVTSAPVLSSQPSAQTVATGGTVTLTVAGSGSPVPTFQWQSSTDGTTWTNVANGGAYSGATTTTLTVTGVTSKSTSYRCVLTNSVGSATSNVATVTINDSVVFTTSPATQSIISGGNASFTVAVTSSQAASFQWQVSSQAAPGWADIANGSVYSGATTSALKITGATSQLNGNQYRCVATSGSASATSAPAVLTVNPANSAPAISSQPTAQTVTTGASVTLTVAGSGSPAPTYQWETSTDSGSSWKPIANGGAYSGATTATLKITGVTATASYRCVLTNAAGSTTSNPVAITVNDTIAFTTQPSPQATASGQDAAFNVAVASTAPATVRWQVSRDGGVTWTEVTAGPAPLSMSTSTIAITSASTATAVVGQPFTFAVTTSAPATRFAATNLPSGISIDPTTGILSGTFTQAGSYSISVEATRDASTATATLQVTVAAK